MRERLNFGINPGRFRHTITHLVPSSTVDASGVVVTYAPGNPPLSVKAEIEYLRGGESLKAGQDVSETYIEVRCRYHPAFRRLERILAPDGNQYVIQSMEDLQMRHVFLTMTCKGVGAGT